MKGFHYMKATRKEFKQKCSLCRMELMVWAFGTLPGYPEDLFQEFCLSNTCIHHWDFCNWALNTEHWRNTLGCKFLLLLLFFWGGKLMGLHQHFYFQEEKCYWENISCHNFDCRSVLICKCSRVCTVTSQIFRGDSASNFALAKQMGQKFNLEPKKQNFKFCVITNPETPK